MDYKISQETVKDLAKILQESDLSEIELETSDGRIRIVRSVSVGASVVSALNHHLIDSSALLSPSPSGSHSTEHSAVSHQPLDPALDPNAVRSPMVGTVYLSPEPGAKPFVSVGDAVSIGQTLLIIESMKVMNPIKAKKTGTVKLICARDASPIEFNEPLMIIE